MININCKYFSNGNCLHKSFWAFKKICKLIHDITGTCDLQEKWEKPMPPPPPPPRKISSIPPKQTIGQINDMIAIDNISKIREQNNRNWMNILKLAFKYAPKEAKEIMADISKCDQEINELTKRLAE